MPAEGTPALLWLPGLAHAGAEFTLEPDDAHYVARVCRAQVGERIEATDGEGTRATLDVLAVRGEVRVRKEALRREAPPPRVVVACGVPEKDRADWLVEKLAELGVSDFQPLECERGRWERFASRRERLARLAVAALRQSRRAWLLKIHDPVGLSGWSASLGPDGGRWLADADGASAPVMAGPGPQAAAIGPSPGFSAAERDVFVKAGFRPVRLASGRLRTETAAVAWASLWAASIAAGGPSG